MKQIDPKNETYEEVRGIVFGLVSQTINKFREIDQDDIESAAHEGFLQAYDSYIPERGRSFKNWVMDKVKYRIQDLIRNNAKKQKPSRLPEEVSYDDRSSEIELWLENLSDDARLVVTYVIAPPPAMKKELRGHVNSYRWKRVLRWYLTSKNWKESRIKSAFQEIRENLP